MKPNTLDSYLLIYVVSGEMYVIRYDKEKDYNLLMDIIENDYLKILTTPYNAAIHSIYSKKYSKLITLVLSGEEEHSKSPTYSGNTIFPFSGRIANAVFNGLELDRNDGATSLHGGYASHTAVFEKTKQSETEVEYRIERKSWRRQNTFRTRVHCLLQLGRQ